MPYFFICLLKVSLFVCLQCHIFHKNNALLFLFMPRTGSSSAGPVHWSYPTYLILPSTFKPSPGCLIVILPSLKLSAATVRSSSPYLILYSATLRRILDTIYIFDLYYLTPVVLNIIVDYNYY